MYWNVLAGIGPPSRRIQVGLGWYCNFDNPIQGATSL
jgi:hypothetical protein